MSDTKRISDDTVDREALEKRVGTVLKGKWTLERLIGVGGVAAVYEAKHEIGRKDAIKILHPDAAKQADWVERFQREAKAVNQVDHPAVIEVRDVDTTKDGEPFMVMELLAGESVNERLKRDKVLPVEDVLRIAHDLLDVLEAAHSAGIVHRDIKPSNLWLEKDGRLRVLDFGVAQMASAKGPKLTEAGTAIGTVAYMSPEQLRGDAVDGRADIFAVGASMRKMLTGKLLFESKSEDELAQKILTEAVAALIDVDAALPDAVGLVVDRALAPRRERRYPTAAEMKKDVSAVRDKKAPPYAWGLFDDGDDPRDLEAPAGEKDTSEEPARDEKTVKRKHSPKATDDDKPVPSDVAPTVKRDVPSKSKTNDDEGDADASDTSDDDSKTVKRAGAKPGGTVIIDDEDEDGDEHDDEDEDEDEDELAAGATQVGGDEDDEELKNTPIRPTKVGKTVPDDEQETKPMKARGAARVQAAPEQKGGNAWMGILVAAVVLGGGYYFMTRSSAETETADPDSSLRAPKKKTKSDQPAGEDPEPDTATETQTATDTGQAAVDEPDGDDDDGAAPKPTDPKPTDPKPTDPKPKPSTTATTAPFPFPSGFPTALPTVLPSTFPTTLPSNIPIPGLPPPPPPPVPKPVPPPTPAPAPAPVPTTP